MGSPEAPDIESLSEEQHAFAEKAIKAMAKEYDLDESDFALEFVAADEVPSKNGFKEASLGGFAVRYRGDEAIDYELYGSDDSRVMVGGDDTEGVSGWVTRVTATVPDGEHVSTPTVFIPEI